MDQEETAQKSGRYVTGSAEKMIHEIRQGGWISITEAHWNFHAGMI